MAVYGVRIESAPPGGLREPGAVVALFDSRDEAEYFISIADNLRSIQGCALAVVVLTILDRR